MGKLKSNATNQVQENAATSKKPVLLTINGVAYNVASWVPYHPGGDAILKWEGRDASDVFTALHSEETFKKLDAFKYKVQDQSTIVPSTEKQKRFVEFRKKLEDLGLFKTNPLWYAYKTISTFAFLFLGAFLVYCDYSILAAISLGIGFQQMGWLGHDYSHHQVFASRDMNRRMSYITGNLGQGFSQRWWNDRHNTHHAITNVLDSDPDVDNLPLFVWSIHDLPKVPDWVKPHLKYQQYYFLFPFCPLLRVIWLLQSAIFVTTLDKHPNSTYRSFATPERVTLALHWVWYLTLLYFASNKFWFVVLSQAIPGFGIAIIVFFNHYACHHYKDTQEEFDFLDLVLVTTRDMEPGIITDWICGGLNYQIEHHMFPTMPRHHLSTARKYVQEYCKENNLPYQSASFTEGVGYLLKQLSDVSSQLEKMKLHDQ